MKINPTQIQNAMGVYRREQAGRQKTAEAKAPAVPSQAADAVELSPEARDIAALKQRLADRPEVREERVAELTRQVQSGTYQVPAKKIAQRILDLGI